MLMKMLSAVYSIEVLLMFSVQFYCESLLAVGYIFICLSLKDVQCFSSFVCFFPFKTKLILLPLSIYFQVLSTHLSQDRLNMSEQLCTD